MRRARKNTSRDSRRLCQHGNKFEECAVPCGIPGCVHACADHTPYVPEPGEIVDDARCWQIRRACRFLDDRGEECHCGVFRDPATEVEARAFGLAFGQAFARDFIEHPEWRGSRFSFDSTEMVEDMSVAQWGMAARYGFDDVVMKAAAEAWIEAVRADERRS